MNQQIKLNFINLVVYFYLLFFVLLLSYTFYQSEIIYNGEQLSYYYKYYLIFISGIVFWFSSLFLNKNRKFLLIIIISCIIFLLYFYEIIRFYEKQLLQLNFLKNINKEVKINDNLKNENKYSVIQRLKQSEGSNNVVPSIYPKILLNHPIYKDKNNILPLAGVSRKTTVFCKEGENHSIYKSDRYGFNNPDSQWEKENIEWFLIGDSFTQGSCVQPGEDIASQIRLLNKQNVISLGMSGNGPLLELASLKEYALIKKPKNILWLYFERNDLQDLKNEKTNSILLNYLNKNFTQSLIYNQTKIDSQLNKYIKIIERNLQNEILHVDKKEKYLSFKKIVRLQIVRDKLSLDRGLDFGLDTMFEKILVNARNYVQQWNGNLYFIYLPDKERYSRNDINDGDYLKRNDVLNLVNNLKIPIIDIHKDFFAKHVDPISFYAHRIYGHFSSDGYNKVTEFILKNIDEK